MKPERAKPEVADEVKDDNMGYTERTRSARTVTADTVTGGGGGRERSELSRDASKPSALEPSKYSHLRNLIKPDKGSGTIKVMRYLFTYLHRN